jgi:hypothetical protein
MRRHQKVAKRSRRKLQREGKENNIFIVRGGENRMEGEKGKRKNVHTRARKPSSYGGLLDNYSNWGLSHALLCH